MRNVYKSIYLCDVRHHQHHTPEKIKKWQKAFRLVSPPHNVEKINIFWKYVCACEGVGIRCFISKFASKSIQMKADSRKNLHNGRLYCQN